MLALWDACNTRNIPAARLAVQGGADVNERDGDYNRTPLMMAAVRGAADISEWLLQQPGIDIDCSDDNGYTAMHWACWNGQVEVLRVLLAAQSQGSINKRDNLGRTPLMSALEYGEVECVRLMGEAAGVDLEARDEGGRTPGRSLEDCTR